MGVSYHIFSCQQPKFSRSHFPFLVSSPYPGSNHSQSHLCACANLCTEALDTRSLLIIQWPWYLGTFEKLMSSSVPEKEYWRSDKPQAEAMVPNMSFLSKLKWSAAMYCSPRGGVGWNYQVLNRTMQATSCLLHRD